MEPAISITGHSKSHTPSIGRVVLAAPFCQAGLAGYSDRAMRLVARRHGCAYAVTEALLDTILLSGGLGLKKSIDINDQDHPIAGQIIGSDPDTMAAAARIMHANNYDVIDLNFACPVKKIKNKARGGHMLRDVSRGLSIMQACRDAVPSDRPMSVSLRRAFDDGGRGRGGAEGLAQECAERGGGVEGGGGQGNGEAAGEDTLMELIGHAVRLGFSAVRVHGRTVEQKYLGRADWGVFARIKAAFPNITLLGSGDVFTAQDVVRMWQETPVDIVWVARGAIGNPWIFSHAADLLAGKTISPPTLFQQRAALEEHFAQAMILHGEQLAGRRMRKMGIKYARFHPNRPEVKAAFVSVQSLRDWTGVIERFYGCDGPGVFPPADAVDEVNDGAGVSCEPGE